MEGRFLSILWDEDNKEHTGRFDIKGHETLKEAVTYLIKTGAKYENQEIVTRVDWMPGDNGLSIKPTLDFPEMTPVTPAIPVDGAPAKPDQPVTLDFSTNKFEPRPGAKSIFDGILPAHMLPRVNDND